MKIPMIRPIIISILLLFVSLVTAQKENNIWYFGNLAGLDFNSTAPVAVLGLIDTNEGSASISDSNGQLLFYTDGRIVRNRNHQNMPNGESLEGGWSSTQSALIVKQPGSLTRYYVFTTSDAITSHLSYSVVDMTLNGGNGDVVQEEKNILLEPSTGEKIAAAYHGNGIDIWIVSHRSGSNEFVAFLLTEEGLDITPVVSSVGSVHEDDKQIGPIRFSHDGSKIVCSAISALGDPGVFELFDFDNCTGIVRNGMNLYEFIPDSFEVYGIEFSPNDHFLYFTYFELFISNYLYQLDLENFNLTLLLQNENSIPYGTIQLGPDQKIYFAQLGVDSLSVIHFPDSAGIACQLEEFFIPLVKGTSCAFGLPNPTPIYQSQFSKNVLGLDTAICIGESLNLDVSLPSGCDSHGILWSDGSTESQLTVTDKGAYWVEATCSCQTFRDSIQISFIECPSPCGNGSGAIYGNPEFNERGYSLAADSVNKVFYAGGIRDSLLFISKMALDGKVLWSRSFDLVPDEEDHLTSMILDSEGMLVVSGTTDAFPVGISVSAMRYDPDANQILWAREYISTPFAQNYDILEKGPGGNYIMSSYNVQNPGTYNEIAEIERITGAIVKIYALNLGKDIFSEEIITETVYHNNYIYGTGRFGDGHFIRRSAIIKIDATNGEIVWSKAGHAGPEENAQFRGVDLVIMDDYIYSLYHGQPDVIEISKIYLQKTSLNGDLIWVREYNLPAAQDIPYEIIQSGNGLVIFAERSTFPAEMILFKIDTAGAVLWKTGFRFPVGHGISKFIGYKASQLIEADSILVFTAAQQLSMQDENMVLVRTDLEGSAQHPCIENFTTNLVTTVVKNPVFYDVELLVTLSTSVENALSVVAMEDELKVLEGCRSGDTRLTIIDTTICQGQIVEGYDSSGVYTDTFVNSSGCDSTRTLILTVLPIAFSSIEKSICTGESFEGYTHTGTYIDTLTGSSGCDSIRTLFLHVLTCEPIVHYDLEACSSYMHNGSHMDYSEFIPAYPNELNCADVSASIVFRSPPQENKHSCTPGVNGSVAMCISTYSGCSYVPGHTASLVFEVEIVPQTDSVVRITSLSFFEKAPATYSWIDGPTGPNNYPQFFAMRILKNGIEVYREEDIETSQTWTLKSFDFLSHDSFLINEPAILRFEFLPYCPVGNGAEVSAWDIDEISVFGGCVPMIQPEPVIAGNVHTKYGAGVSGVDMQLSKGSDFAIHETDLTNQDGNYMFDQLQLNHSYFLQGYKNDDVLNGVSTLDLLLIRKHLLGITPFTSLDQYIAADINHNGKISVLDLAELQKLLLGINTTFSNNTSWRFGPLPQDMTGSDMSVFNEVSLVESLVHDTLVVDFLGIKIGDISGDVVPLNPEIQIENRTLASFPIIIDDQSIRRDQMVSIPVKAGEDAIFEGLQLAINLQNIELLDIKSSSIQLSAEDYSFIDGVLRVSWAPVSSVTLNKDDVLFEVVCRSSIKTNLSEAISLNQKALHPELYQTGLEIKNLDLVFSKNGGFAKEGSHTLRIEPNPVSTEAQIHFALDKEGQTIIRLVDSQGRLLYENEKYLSEGAHEEKIALENFSTYQGVVYCQVITTTYAVTEKFVKL